MNGKYKTLPITVKGKCVFHRVLKPLHLKVVVRTCREYVLSLLVGVFWVPHLSHFVTLVLKESSPYPLKATRINWANTRGCSPLKVNRTSKATKHAKNREAIHLQILQSFPSICFSPLDKTRNMSSDRFVWKTNRELFEAIFISANGCVCIDRTPPKWLWCSFLVSL